MRSLWFILGLLGASAVALGAYGSHADAFTDAGAQALFDIALRYHIAHLLALGLAALVGSVAPAVRRRAGFAGLLFLAGIALFSGSLYMKALGLAEVTDPLAPSGGVALMAGWVLLAWAGIGAVAPRGAGD